MDAESSEIDAQSVMKVNLDASSATGPSLKNETLLDSDSGKPDLSFNEEKFDDIHNEGAHDNEIAYYSEGDGDIGEESDPDDLDPNDPVVAQFQAALLQQLEESQIRIDESLLEKDEELRRLNKKREDIGVELYGLQQQLARMQMQLEKTHDRFNVFSRLRAKAEQEKMDLVQELSQKEANRKEAEERAELVGRDLQQAHETVRQLSEHNDKLQSEITVTRRAAYAEEAEMGRIEKEKKAQDYMIDSMNTQIEQLQNKIKTLKMQREAQKKQTMAAKETIKLGLSEIEQIRLDKVDYMSKWKSSLVAISRRDNALEKCHAEREKLEVELESLKAAHSGLCKSIRDEQEASEKLATILSKVQTDVKFIEGQIERIESMRAKTSSDSDLLKKQLDAANEELQHVQTQRKHVELETRRIDKAVSQSIAARNAIEDQIFEHISNQTTISQSTQNILKNSAKIRAQIEEKEKKIGNTQNEIARIKIDILNTEAHNRDLKKNLADLEKELSSRDAIVKRYDAEISARHDEIQKKQISIDALNRKNEALTKNVVDNNIDGSLEAKIDHLEKLLKESRIASTDLQRKWMGAQNQLIEVEALVASETNKVSEMQARHTVLDQKQKRIERQIVNVDKEIAELKRAIAAIHSEISRLNIMLADHKNKEAALQADNYAREHIAMEREGEIELSKQQGAEKLVALRNAKAALIVELGDLTEQVLLWERKIALEKETQKAIDPEFGQAEVEMIRKEVHRMELRLHAIKRKQNEILDDGLRAITRRTDIQNRYLSTKKSTLTQSALRKQIASLRADIKTKTEEARLVDQKVKAQEGDSAKLIATCEALHSQFEELDETKLSVTNKIRLAEFQKQLAVEMLAIYTEAKSRLSNATTRIPESSESSLAEHTERLEQLKSELRSMKSMQLDLEPYFDSILSHATSF